MNSKIILTSLLLLLPFTLSAEVVRCKFNLNSSGKYVKEFTINLPSVTEYRFIFSHQEQDVGSGFVENNYISGPPHEFSTATVLDKTDHKAILKEANVFTEVIWFPPASGNTSSRIAWARIDWI